MDKTYRNELHRLFLLDHLPEPLKPSDAHLQIFDNYIENTRLRLRTVRIPETGQRTRILQQRFASGTDAAHWKVAEIYLSEAEYHLFERFADREIRKNRYFYEIDGRPIKIDIFLGDLTGLKMARVEFEMVEEMPDFKFPFAVLEVTPEIFFDGATLVGKNFNDVQSEVARLVKTRHSKDTIIGEIAKENE